MCEDLRDAAAARIVSYLSEAEVGEPTRDMQLLGTGAVASLEAKLRRQYGVRCAVAVTNATTGLLGTALALGLRDAEIITTPFTWAGTVAPFLILGNRVAFADIEPDTLTVDPDSVSRLVTRKTRAIVAADVFGVPCDVRGLREVADRFGLLLVVDAAQSFGATRDGLPPGNGADATVLSFGPGKGIFAGEGGAVLGDQGLFDRVVWFLQHGARQKRQLGLSLDNEFALNGRIHPMAAIWADTRFDAFVEAVEARRADGFRVVESLNETGLTMRCDYGSRHISPSFDRLTAAWRLGAHDSDLLEILRRRGVESEILPIPVRLLHTQPAFQALYRRKLVRCPVCPVAEDQVRRRFEIRPTNRATWREVA